MRDDYERVICGPSARGLYESHYLKANHPEGRGALWIKHTIMAPSDPALPRFAELWAIIWRRAGEAPLVARALSMGDALWTSDRELSVQTETVSLTPDRARGELRSEGPTIAWDLSLRGDDGPLFHSPHESMYRYRFPTKKMMTPRPFLELSGHLEVEGERIPVDRWVGLRGHNWGTRHPQGYAYANANMWDQPGRWAFEGFSVRLLLRGIVSPWLRAAVVRLPRGELRLNALRGVLDRHARVAFPSWSTTFQQAGNALKIACALTPEEAVGLRYLSPDGRLSYCYSSKLARLDFSLRRPGRRAERRTSRFAELEFLTAEPIAGIPLHGDDVLPR